MVALVLVNGFEEIEAVSVVDILRRGGINVKIVSISDKRELTGRNGVKLIVDDLISNIDKSDIDMLILPGGPGVIEMEKSQILKELIQFCSQKRIWLSAICAAPSILGKLGLLKGENATCYPGYEKYLEGAKVLEEKVVLSNRFITSMGAGTTFDFAFKIIEVLKSIELAEKIKKDIIYS